jgi:HSP20 family protein
MYGNTSLRFTPRGVQLGNYNTLNNLNRAVEELFGELARPGYEGQENIRPWQPLVDIVETEQAYEVRAELPGIAKEDVQLAIENNVLTLSGERKFEKDVNKESYHRIERAYGSFSRSFTLPARVDAERVEARYENGLLTVAIPKAAEARPRKIEIG